MSIVNGYATLAEAKSYLKINDTDDDTAVEAAVEAASRAIDTYCGRFFYDSTAATYTYTSLSPRRVYVDDVRTVTTLKTDSSGDGTFDVTWTAADYLLEPANSPNASRPYTHVTVRPHGSYQFPGWVNAVQIVGDFGWAAVPKPVFQACIRLAGLIVKTGQEGSAPIVTMDGTTINMASRYMDGYVQMLLNPYRRGGKAPGLVVA